MIGLLDRGCIHCGVSIADMCHKFMFKWIEKDNKPYFICGNCGRESSYHGGEINENR
jgi:hypothetical protein